MNFKPDNNDVDIHLTFQKEVYKPNQIKGFVYDYREIRRWCHLDFMQYKTWITAKIPRVLSTDGTIKSVKVPWAGDDKRYTYLFENMAIEILLATKN